MKRTWWRLCLSFFVGACLTAGAVLLLLRVNANARPPAQGVSPPPPAANSTNVTGGISDLTPYVTKGAIEMPTEQLLAVKTVSAPVPPSPPFVNPKVEPGKVRWHKTFADACAAAKKSNKPVLLFQMMGNLDERFC
jgi:hypothetical protein